MGRWGGTRAVVGCRIVWGRALRILSGIGVVDVLVGFLEDVERRRVEGRREVEGRVEMGLGWKL
jgi:hypothetical protein